MYKGSGRNCSLVIVKHGKFVHRLRTSSTQWRITEGDGGSQVLAVILGQQRT